MQTKINNSSISSNSKNTAVPIYKFPSPNEDALNPLGRTFDTRTRKPPLMMPCHYMNTAGIWDTDDA